MGTMNTELKTKSILTRTVKTVMKMMMAATRTVDDDNGGNTNQDNGVDPETEEVLETRTTKKTLKTRVTIDYDYAHDDNMNEDDEEYNIH